MAVSDPTYGVPTPTGVLQGVAAFNWDGSLWQPSASAGPCVATPTGILQGVAPFSWSGSAWTPAGRSQPGVPTPTGVLDGVAVYTWSGSAWTPASGTPTPSTPTGALRGVAAFQWDGSAWQPAGQAGPDVPTPFGVLQGVAMFNWTGSAWAAAQPPSLVLDFMTPGTLPPGFVFTRASVGTYFDAAGTLQTATSGTPRWDYDPVTHVLRGLMAENAATNVLLNSATLNTQSVTVTAQAYTLSFYGTGTITLSGVSTAGPLVGTGVFPTRVSLTFTPTAGSLTLTVTGSVLNAQLEAGVIPTSWVPTAGATASRVYESMTMPLGAWFSATASSMLAEYMMPQSPNPVAGVREVAMLNDGTASNRLVLRGLNASTAVTLFYSIVAGSTNVSASLGTVTALVPTKIAAAWNGVTPTGSLNGAATLSYSQGLPSGLTTLALNAPQPLNGWIRRVSYWPRALSAAELRAATT